MPLPLLFLPTPFLIPCQFSDSYPKFYIASFKERKQPSGWGPRNKFGAQLLDSLIPNLEKIFCAHIGN